MGRQFGTHASSSTYKFTTLHDTHTARLAVLIDADNAQTSMSNLVLAEVAKYGTAFVKRAYGEMRKIYFACVLQNTR